MKEFRDIRSVDIVPLIRVRVCIGDGNEGDIVRINTEWWDQEGNLVYAEPDKFADDMDPKVYEYREACKLLGHPSHDGKGCICGAFALRLRDDASTTDGES